MDSDTAMPFPDATEPTGGLPEPNVGADALGRLAVQPALLIMPAVINTTGTTRTLQVREGRRRKRRRRVLC